MIPSRATAAFTRWFGQCLLASCATTPQISPAARAELAPTGKLRAGINYGNVVPATKDLASGELRGVSVSPAAPVT